MSRPSRVTVPFEAFSRPIADAVAAHHADDLGLGHLNADVVQNLDEAVGKTDVAQA